MESAALFVVASYLNVKVGSVFLTVANQEREKQNLENPVVHDTEKAIKTAIEAIKILKRIKLCSKENGICNQNLLSRKCSKNFKTFLMKCQ